MSSSWSLYAIASFGSFFSTYSLTVCRATSFPRTTHLVRHGFHLLMDQDFTCFRIYGVDCGNLCWILEESGVVRFFQHSIAMYGSVTYLFLLGQLRRSICYAQLIHVMYRDNYVYMVHSNIIFKDIRFVTPLNSWQGLFEHDYTNNYHSVIVIYFLRGHTTF